MLSAFTEWMAEEQMRVSQLIETGTKLLQDAGLKTSAVVREGDPKKILLREAEEWKAEVLFLGAKDLTRTSRLRLGSVSSAVAARAHCTVEIIR